MLEPRCGPPRRAATSSWRAPTATASRRCKRLTGLRVERVSSSLARTSTSWGWPGRRARHGAALPDAARPRGRARQALPHGRVRRASTAEVLEPFLAEYYGLATHVPPLLLLPPSDIDVATWGAFLARAPAARWRCARRAGARRWRCSEIAARNARSGLEAELALLERRGEAPGVRSCRRCWGCRRPRGGSRRSTCRTSWAATRSPASSCSRAAGPRRASIGACESVALEAPDDFASHAPGGSPPVQRQPGRPVAPPDLVLIDGGKGQLSAARRALADAGIDVPLVGLAKRVETIVTERAASCCCRHVHPALRS
jgi:excinuclease ABC subunit C